MSVSNLWMLSKNDFFKTVFLSLHATSLSTNAHLFESTEGWCICYGVATGSYYWIASTVKDIIWKYAKFHIVGYSCFKKSTSPEIVPWTENEIVFTKFSTLFLPPCSRSCNEESDSIAFWMAVALEYAPCVTIWMTHSPVQVGLTSRRQCEWTHNKTESTPTFKQPVS